MSFSADLKNFIFAKYSMLNHPFYQAWACGTLPLESLQEYTKQYFHHEANLPRYLSSIHSRCDDHQIRQVILENLIDEEKDLKKNHKQLWINFANSIGVSSDEVFNSKANKNTQEAIDSFFSLSSKSTPSGIGAMFGYEVQIPEVYKSKIDGLDKYYKLKSEKGREFFDIHLEMDKWHSNQWSDIIDKMNEQEKEECKISATESAKQMLHFLDGIKINC